MIDRHLSVEDFERLAGRVPILGRIESGIAHLLRCAPCRRRLDTLPADTRGLIEARMSVLRSGEDYSLGAYAGALDAVLEKVSEEGRELDRQRLLAPALLDELDGLSQAQQRLIILNSIKYQSWAVAEELLDASRRVWTEAPREGEHLAWVVTEIAETLSAKGFRERILNDIKAEAWSYVGNCRRIQANLRGSDDAFSRAAVYLEAGTGDPFERAQFDGLRASLLRDQRRFREASRLLETVVQTYRGAGDKRLEARSLLVLGKALIDSGAFEPSLRTIRRAVQLLEGQDEPRLEFVAKHQFVVSLNETGRVEEAQDQLPELRRLVREVGNRLDRLRVLWTEGRIWTALGRFELAEEALKQVRAGFIDAEIGYDVALVSLDLAALYLETGRTAEVKELAAEMLPQFAARQIHREALAAIALFEQAARKERATLALVQEISSKVKDASTHRTPAEND